MTPLKVQLFTTPRPGFRSRARAKALVKALRNAGAEILPTKSNVHPLAIHADAEHVCAVGGDGTLRYVIDAVGKLDRPVSVSSYPVGTVNLVQHFTAQRRGA